MGVLKGMKIYENVNYHVVICEMGGIPCYGIENLVTGVIEARCRALAVAKYVADFYDKALRLGIDREDSLPGSVSLSSLKKAGGFQGGGASGGLN